MWDPICYEYCEHCQASRRRLANWWLRGLGQRGSRDLTRWWRWSDKTFSLFSLRSQNVHRNDNRILNIKITRNVLQFIKRLIVVSLRINNDLTDQSPLFLSYCYHWFYKWNRSLVKIKIILITDDICCKSMIILISDNLISQSRDSKTYQTQMVSLNLLAITNNIYLSPLSDHAFNYSILN